MPYGMILNLKLVCAWRGIPIEEGQVNDTSASTGSIPIVRDTGSVRIQDQPANGSNETPKAVNLAGSHQDAVGDVGSRQITSSRQEPVVEGTALQS